MPQIRITQRWLFVLLWLALAACVGQAPETPPATTTPITTASATIFLSPRSTSTPTPLPDTPTPTNEPSPTQTALPTATPTTILEPLIKVIQAEAVLNSVAFSPDGKRLVVGTNLSTAEVWEVDSGEKILTLKGHTQGDVSFVAYSPDGNLIATAGQDKTVRLWDAKTGESLQVLKGGEVSVAFSPDGQWLAAGGKDGVARVWNVNSGALRFSFPDHPEGALSVAFEPGAQITFSTRLQTPLAALVSRPSLKRIPVSYHLGGPHENALAVGTGAGKIVFWDLTTGEKLRTLEAGSGRIWSLAYIDRSILVSGGDDQIVKAWIGGDPHPYQELFGHSARIWSLATLPTTGWLGIVSGGDDHTVRLWSDQPIGFYEGHTDKVYGVAISPNRDMIASVGRDKTIRLWRPVRTWHFPTAYVHLKPDCLVGEVYTSCVDPVLGMAFDHPENWGELTAQFWPGEEGYGYEYATSNNTGVGIEAGGRSRRFAEGRGRKFTDFSGGATCSSTTPLCETMQSGVVFNLAFPQANEFCSPGPGRLGLPIATVAINLPTHPSINGFIFITHFLSQNLSDELTQTLGPGDPQGSRYRCNEEDQKLFDAKVQALIQQVRSGTVDATTQENLNQLRHLARSITFK